MPGTLADIFTADAFSLRSLTDSVNKLPAMPTRLRDMGLFEDQGIQTTTVMIEEKEGILELVPSTARGAPATSSSDTKRKARSFAVAHLAQEKTVQADDVLNVRRFGSDNQLDAVSSVVNEKLQGLRQNVEVTLEWLKMGALKGIILDGDASTTLYNLFTEFGIATPADVDWALGTSATDIQTKCVQLKRGIEKSLGGTVMNHVHVLAGATWFDKLVAHPNVKYAFQYANSGAFMRTDNRRGFQFCDIIFEEYVGSIGGKEFIAPAEAQAFPVGVPGLFKTYYAPADFMETVNTLGLPLYAKQAIDAEFQRWVKLHVQSNPLPLCLRPGCLRTLTTST